MSDNWIKMRTNLSRTPEVYQIAAETGLDRFAVVGRLHEVWSWFDQMTENGNAVGVTYVTVDDIVCNAGFAQAMHNAGWLDFENGVLTAPQFDRHNGQTARKRANTARRVAAHRGKSKPVPDAPKSVTPTALPREEKRKKKVPPKPPRGEPGTEDLFVSKTSEGQEPFDVFWEIVPHKIGRGAAQKAFERASKGCDPWTIVRRSARYVAAEMARYRLKPEDYQPLHPATWLNQQRFLDEPESIPVPPKKLLLAAWVASGRNGSGPPDWKVLANDEETVASMRASSPAFDLLVDGIKECVQIVKGAQSA